DVPNARSSHLVPTPRGGGVAIVAGFALAIVYLYGRARLPFDLLMALAGGLPVAAMGFWDDHGHVSARLRLLVQVAAAAWAVYWLGGLESVTVAGGRYDLGWFGHALAGLFVVWLLNLFNFMDGIDGIAGMEAISVALMAAFLAVAPGAGVVLLALAAAAGGFLVWNWPPAKIFMGDVGSGCVGFLLGVLALRMAATSELSLVVWLILLGVFFVDATLTLLRRMASGQRWYEAHRSHAYQHAAHRWASHRRVTLAALALNLGWLWPWAAVAVAWPRWEIVVLMVAYAPLIGLALRLDAGKS
ncbi:MraY family glycosyltransferase, partial [Methylomagnum sp.]